MTHRSIPEDSHFHAGPSSPDIQVSPAMTSFTHNSSGLGRRVAPASPRVSPRIMAHLVVVLALFSFGLVAMAQAQGEPTRQQVMLDLAPASGFATRLVLTAEGGFRSFALEQDPFGQRPPEVVLRALKGQLAISESSFSLQLAQGAPGVLAAGQPRLVIDSSGRLAQVVIPYNISQSERHPAIAGELPIRVVMDMAQMLYQPVQLEVRDIESAEVGSERHYRFNVRFDATGSERAIRWSFLRLEVYNASGQQAVAPQYREAFAEVQNRNSVRVLNGLQVTVPSNSGQGLSLRGIAVGLDSEGVVLVQPFAATLP